MYIFILSIIQSDMEIVRIEYESVTEVLQRKMQEYEVCTES